MYKKLYEEYKKYLTKIFKGLKEWQKYDLV